MGSCLGCLLKCLDDDEDMTYDYINKDYLEQPLISNSSDEEEDYYSKQTTYVFSGGG